MNKKLIAIGIAAALAVPFSLAQAGVEVYGQVRTSVDYSNNGDDRVAATPIPPGTGDDMQKTKMSVSSNASYIGFKGDEDLGNGLTAMWQFQQGVAFDTGNWNDAQMPTYVGVAGGFGAVLAGRFDSPYMTATDGYDIFADTKADYNGIMGAAHGLGAIFDSRVSNTLVYATPDLSGFKGALAYVASTALGSDNLSMTKDDAKKDAYSLSGNYNNGPLSLAVAYQVANDALNKVDANDVPIAGFDSITGWKVGGSYTIMDATTVALIYENLDVAQNIKDRNAYYLNVAHKMGNTTLKAAYANADKCSGDAAHCDKTGASQFSLGVSQALTKNTEVYALYTQLSNDDFGEYSLAYGPGFVTKADNTNSDMSSFSIGINHSFSSK